MTTKDRAQATCHRCKKTAMKLVYVEMKIIGFECSNCGARRCYGDPQAPAGAWPKAQKWLELQKLEPLDLETTVQDGPPPKEK